MIRGWRCLLPFAIACAAACGSGGSPNPSPPGSSGGESITGRERIGWDQQAATAADLATFRYAIYVDGARSELADVTCATTAGPAGFACSARLPSMSAGTHTLELATFIDAGGLVESARSAPLRVTVTGATAPAPQVSLASGETVVTADGEALVAARLTEMQEPTGISVARDGRIFVTDAAGRLRLVEDGRVTDVLHLPETEPQGGLLAVALAHDFDTSGRLFVVAAFRVEEGHVFRVMRLRLAAGRAVDRMVLLPDVPASSEPAAALGLGPDGKLYAAFDSADDDDRALRLSEWSGKILRLDPDGRTPADQPAASPVLWSGVRVPRGLDWTADGTLWAAEEGIDGIERVRGLAASGADVRRATSRASYLLPRPFNGRSVAAYRGDAVRGFEGNLFVAGGDADYLLRISFDREDRGRAVATERLLEGRLETVRAVAAGHDGALYFATHGALWRLTASARPPGPAER